MLISFRGWMNRPVVLQWTANQPVPMGVCRVEHPVNVVDLIMGVRGGDAFLPVYISKHVISKN